MTDRSKSAPPSAQDILFPAFIYGEKAPCRRKMKAEAKKWAKAFEAGREFPEPKLVPIAPGSVVCTEVTTADLIGLGYNFIPNTNRVIIDGDTARQEGRHIQWRLYMFDDLRFEAAPTIPPSIEPEIGRKKSWAFAEAFNAFMCKYPWGALSAAIGQSPFRDIQFILPRIEGVLRHWDTLDQLKYINMDTYPISLSALMASDFCGQITMWVDRPTGNIRTDLQTAMEQMRQASPDETYTRLVRRLRELVDTERSLKQRDWLRSPGIIERGLEVERQQGQWQYDDLTSGQNSALGGFLFLLERNYGPGGEFTLP